MGKDPRFDDQALPVMHGGFMATNSLVRAFALVCFVSARLLSLRNRSPVCTSTSHRNGNTASRCSVILCSIFRGASNAKV